MVECMPSFQRSSSSTLIVKNFSAHLSSLLQQGGTTFGHFLSKTLERPKHTLP